MQATAPGAEKEPGGQTLHADTLVAMVAACAVPAGHSAGMVELTGQLQRVSGGWGEWEGGRVAGWRAAYKVPG